MSNEKSAVNNKEQKKGNLYVKNLEQKINLKIEEDLVIVEIPDENKKDPNQWEHLTSQFQSVLKGMEKEWPPETEVKLLVKRRLLDNRQLQTITKIFEDAKLKLKLVVTSRRQTAITVASAGYSVQQESEAKPLIQEQKHQLLSTVNPLYIKNTIRSGSEVYHTGTVIIFGDVNPGGSIIARGDVFIWGSLKGIAHAGANGNREAVITALKMDPTQLRIADLVARSPGNLPEDFEPEIAYISKDGIRITSAFNFNKNNFFSNQTDSWTDSNNQGLI